MSDTKIDCAAVFIPEDMHFVPSVEVAQKSVESLKKLLPYAAEYSFETFEAAKFISPELFASSAVCPVCGVSTVRGSSKDDAGRVWFASIDDSKSKLLETDQTTLPACGHAVPLAQVEFDYASGFARFVLTARFTYFDEELMSDDLQQSEKTAGLSQLIGVPLRAIRIFYALLPADRKIFELLLSADDDERLQGAEGFESREQGHFEDHSIDRSYIEDHAAKLIVAYKNTKHHLVKYWILFLLAEAEYVCTELTEIVASELNADSELLQQILYVMYRTPKQFQDLKDELKKLHNHSSEGVRWRVALVLKLLLLSHPEDIEVVRALMLDDYYAARLEGVFAFKTILASDPDPVLRESDKVLLQSVIDKDGTGSAAYYAKELLSKG